MTAGPLEPGSSGFPLPAGRPPGELGFRLGCVVVSMTRLDCCAPAGPSCSVWAWCSALTSWGCPAFSPPSPPTCRRGWRPTASPRPAWRPCSQHSPASTTASPGFPTSTSLRTSSHFSVSVPSSDTVSSFLLQSTTRGELFVVNKAVRLVVGGVKGWDKSKSRDPHDSVPAFIANNFVYLMTL